MCDYHYAKRVDPFGGNAAAEIGCPQDTAAARLSPGETRLVMFQSRERHAVYSKTTTKD